MLHDELRAARSRWRQGRRAPREIVDPSALRRGYGKSDAEIISPGKVAEATQAVVDSLRPEWLVTPFEDGYLLDHLLHVGFRVSLPHARFGGLHWSFPFSGEEPEDVILGLAFLPPPLVEHVETFVFRASRIGKSPHTVRPLLDPKRKSPTHNRLPAGEALSDLLRSALRFRGRRAEQLLLASMRGKERVSLVRLATELSWPVRSTRTLYRKLELRGEEIPPWAPLFRGACSSEHPRRRPQCVTPRQHWPFQRETPATGAGACR